MPTLTEPAEGTVANQGPPSKNLHPESVIYNRIPGASLVAKRLPTREDVANFRNAEFIVELACESPIVRMKRRLLRVKLNRIRCSPIHCVPRSIRI